MIKDIIDEKLKEISKRETLESLGDRSKYVGASDVVGCPRKAILTKLQPPEFDNETLIRLMRGHLAETILVKCFSEINYRWKTQMEFVHPEYDYIKAHADFVFYTKDFSKIGIVEQKSVSSIPDEPYPSWVEQLQFQMGLAKLLYPKAEIKGSLFVIDLNSGKYEEFNGYEPNDEIFDVLLENAKKIYEFVQNNQVDDLPIEPGLLCGYCPFKADCPAFTGDESEVPEDVQKAVESYMTISQEEKNLKREKDNLKQEIIGYTGPSFKAAFNGYKLSVKETVSTRVDTKVLKAEYPDVYEAVVKQTPFLSFRVS